MDQSWTDSRHDSGSPCTRTNQSFLARKAEIADNEYDRSEVEYDPPKVILEWLAVLEKETTKGRAELEGLLG